jgi:magnesium transporter
MTLINNAVYVEGERLQPMSLADTFDVLREERDKPGRDLAWIGLLAPAEAELAELAAEFGLHQLAVDDAVMAHQRPKLERYDATLFAVLRTVWHEAGRDELDFGELHIFMGPDFVITVRHGAAPQLPKVRRRMETEPDLLAQGPEAVLYAIIDQVVDEYRPIVTRLESIVDEIQIEVFRGDTAAPKRIFKVFRDVIEFQRATAPLKDMLELLARGFNKYGVDPELQRYLADVKDHAVQVAEHAEGFRQLLEHILTVNATLVGQRQNEEMKNLTHASLRQNEQVKKLSAWAAILFAPTLVGTIYGMNFTHIPELEWRWGYPLALALMVCTSVVLYMIFKLRKWL